MEPTDSNFARAIQVRAESAQLAMIRTFVEEVASGLAIHEERLFDLKVAVSEACANAVQHAGCGESLLEIAARVQNAKLTFEVTDSGSFHPPAQPKPTQHNRGLGMPLMVALMDEVNFARLPGGGTTVSLSLLL
jgi:serine/threonine-protein kinase RsbW